MGGQSKTTSQLSILLSVRILFRFVLIHSSATFGFLHISYICVMRIAHPRHVWHRRNRLSDYKILLYFDSLLSAPWNSSQVFFSRRHSLQNSPFFSSFLISSSMLLVLCAPAVWFQFRQFRVHTFLYHRAKNCIYCYLPHILSRFRARRTFIYRSLRAFRLYPHENSFSYIWCVRFEARTRHCVARRSIRNSDSIFHRFVFFRVVFAQTFLLHIPFIGCQSQSNPSQQQHAGKQSKIYTRNLAFSSGTTISENIFRCINEFGSELKMEMDRERETNGEKKGAGYYFDLCSAPFAHWTIGSRCFNLRQERERDTQSEFNVSRTRKHCFRSIK